MSTHEIADEIADEPQPTIDPALNIQPHRQSPTPENKFETANSGHSSPHSDRSPHQNDNFQDMNPLIQSTQHELRAIEVTNPMSTASEQPTPELYSNFAPESAISREAYINVQSSTIPERNDGAYLDKNASPAEVTGYLRGLQSKLDTILKSSVVLHQSPLTSPVKSHSTFPTKDRVDSMYSPSNDLFKYSNNFSDFNSFKARPVGDSVYASVNNDAKFFSAREAPKSSYTSNRYDNINSSMVNVNGSMIGKSRTMDVGSPMTTLSTYIPPNPSSQYSSVQKDRNHQVIEAMKTNEAKLDQIIENIRRKNAGGAVGAVRTTESRVTTIVSPQIYNSRVTIASPQSMTRKTEFYSQPGETIKRSHFVPATEYSSVEFRDRENKRSFQHDRQASISNSYWLDSHEKSKYLGASTISNTHVPLKLRADRNNPAEQSDREVVREEGHQKIQRYYIPDPTVKERDTKDHHDMRAMQSRPLQFGGSNTGPIRREYRNEQRHLEVLEDDSAFHCQDLEDDNQSELGETQTQVQAQNQEPIQINQEGFVYGGSATFTNKRGHQSKVEKPKVVVTKKNLEKLSQVQVQIKKEPSSGVERSQPGSSISKFFEKDSEIDDFVFE